MLVQNKYDWWRGARFVDTLSKTLYGLMLACGALCMFAATYNGHTRHWIMSAAKHW